jgi:hypothetical protein
MKDGREADHRDVTKRDRAGQDNFGAALIEANSVKS